MMFHCSYCKTNGHFTRNCLKLLTKNCHSNVCRNFNRYEVSKCEINGTCVFNRAHTCLFCNEPNCKAYLHINIQDAGSPNLPKRSANIIKALTNALHSCVEAIKDLEGRLKHSKTSSPLKFTRSQHQTSNSSRVKADAEIQSPSLFSTAKESRRDFPSHCSITLPVVSVNHKITMPVIPDLSLSSVSSSFAKDLMDALGNKDLITPLEPAESAIVAATHSTHLRPCGSMIVPLTFGNNITFRFKMLVVPEQYEKIIFGRNHIMKTEADINVPKRCITFRDPKMNFTLDFELRDRTHKDPT